MELVKIYECFCDRTRLRMLNLLARGPLCVCHFQEILGEPQVKISKHLAYLKTRGLVEARREANWMIYHLPRNPEPELKANLACLQDCASEDPIFRKDTERLSRLRGKFEKESPLCSPKPLVRSQQHKCDCL
jgi:ArsR family transcriptional regulator, arsenate/arsenite/antimonite-responsive transcriptional repressor